MRKKYLFNIDTSLYSDCSIRRQQILFMNASTRNHFLQIISPDPLLRYCYFTKFTSFLIEEHNIYIIIII